MRLGGYFRRSSNHIRRSCRTDPARTRRTRRRSRRRRTSCRCSLARTTTTRSERSRCTRRPLRTRRTDRRTVVACMATKPHQHQPQRARRSSFANSDLIVAAAQCAVARRLAAVVETHLERVVAILAQRIAAARYKSAFSLQIGQCRANRPVDNEIVATGADERRDARREAARRRRIVCDDDRRARHVDRSIDRSQRKLCTTAPAQATAVAASRQLRRSSSTVSYCERADLSRR